METSNEDCNPTFRNCTENHQSLQTKTSFLTTTHLRSVSTRKHDETNQQCGDTHKHRQDQTRVGIEVTRTQSRRTSVDKVVGQPHDWDPGEDEADQRAQRGGALEARRIQLVVWFVFGLCLGCV